MISEVFRTIVRGLNLSRGGTISLERNEENAGIEELK